MIENNNGSNQQQQQRRPGPSLGGQQIGGDFFSALAQVGGGHVAQGIGGEYFSKFRETTEKIAGDLLRDVNMRIIGLSRQEYQNLRFSVLVLAFTLEGEQDSTAYHTLILEATGEKLKPEMRPIDGQQVRVNYVTGDANDAALAELAARAVQENYPNRTCYSVGATVVPNTIDAASIDAVTNVVRNAAVAGVSAIQTVMGAIAPITLSQVTRDTSLILDMTTGNAVNYDAVGNPQRSSISISLSARRKSAGASDPSVVNTASDQVKICDISGFVNPIWAPLDAGASGFGYLMPQQQVAQGKLVSEFVITGVHTPYAQSPTAVALAVATSLLAADNNNWVQGLIPKSFSQKNDMTDPGTLNVICNIGNETANGIWGTPIDTSEMSTDLVRFNKMIGQMFRPGTAISIDCPESGPQSWYLNMFAAAAMGDPGAIESVVGAFDELFDGKFSEMLAPGSTLFSNVSRVPMGYYVDAAKTKRDIRDVDLIVVSNAFRSNPENIHTYNDTWLPRAQSSAITNLSKREGIIGHILREQYEITGYAMRCTFSAAAIDAISKALQMMRVNTTINTPLSADALRVGTPAPAHITAAVANTMNSYVNNGLAAGRHAMPYSHQQFRR